MAATSARGDSLSSLFQKTGGSGRIPLDSNAPGMEYMDPSSQFMENFMTPNTGANGGGPILNANANLLPTRADEYRDLANTLDYRMNNGLGVSSNYRKPDSLGGQTVDGFQGMPYPSKMFGRNSVSYDLNYKRDEMRERASAGLKKMGFRPNEVPQFADYMPWEWNNTTALGISGAQTIGNPNQYNRNYPIPDADAVARRMYQPAPSRQTQMLSTDVEEAALRPQQTLMHPMKVVTEDRQRMKLQRIPRNSDVIEAVLYENIEPRGMGNKVEAPRVWSDVSVLREAVGTNDTGSRAVNGRWENPHSNVNPLHDTTTEDLLIMAKDDFRYVQGKDPEFENKEYGMGELELRSQHVLDTFDLQPKSGLAKPRDFPHDASTINGPLRVVPEAGREI